ncbi:MAG: hypothetical protein R2695_01990 [Acidimicrobiales bacterium]
MPAATRAFGPPWRRVGCSRSPIRSTRPATQPVAEAAEPDDLLRPGRSRHLHRRGERGCSGHVGRARSPTPFLTTTEDLGRELHPGADEERAGAGGSAELVPGDRDEVDIGDDRREVDPADRLHRVGVHHCARCMASHHRRQGGKVVDRARLVVDGDQETIDTSGVASSNPARVVGSTVPSTASPTVWPAGVFHRLPARRGARRPNRRRRHRGPPARL